MIKLRVSNVHKDDHGYATIVHETSKSTSVVPFLLKGPNNRKLTVKEFEKLTKDGCCYCTTNLLAENHEKITWDEQGNAYCEDCAEILTYTSTEF